MHVLTIFAKDPRLGFSKSRLARTIGDERAFQIAEALLADTLTTAHSVNDSVTKSVCYTPDDDAAGQRFAERAASLERAPQCGDDLGQRMTRAFQTWFDRGAARVVIIGTDCPTLAPETIEAAFEKLAEADVVLGPAADGGYYLIGLSSLQPMLFQEIDWGGATVLSRTVARIQAAELSLALLPTHADLDTAEHLQPIHGQLQALHTVGIPLGQATRLAVADVLANGNGLG